MEIARLSRLAPLDKALVLILVPIWFCTVVLSLQTQLRDTPASFLGLSVEGPEHYPTVSGPYSHIV
jgi:hypothetical protein